MKTAKNFAFLVLLTIAAACGKQEAATPKPTAVQSSSDAAVGPGYQCPDVYDPVCGSDGVTYSNSCYAQRAGVKSYTRGACGQNPDI